MNNMWFDLLMLYLMVGSFYAGTQSDDMFKNGFWSGTIQVGICFGIILVAPLLLFFSLFELICIKLNKVFQINFFFRFYIRRKKFDDVQITRLKGYVLHFQTNSIRDRIWRKCVSLAVRRHEKEYVDKLHKLFLFTKLMKDKNN